MWQSLTTVFKVPQALSVAPSLRKGRYNQGPSGTLNSVFPSEAAPNYYIFICRKGMEEALINGSGQEVGVAKGNLWIFPK